MDLATGLNWQGVSQNFEVAVVGPLSIYDPSGPSNSLPGSATSVVAE